MTEGVDDIGLIIANGTDELAEAASVSGSDALTNDEGVEEVIASALNAFPAPLTPCTLAAWTFKIIGIRVAIKVRIIIITITQQVTATQAGLSPLQSLILDQNNFVSLGQLPLDKEKLLLFVLYEVPLVVTSAGWMMSG